MLGIDRDEKEKELNKLTQINAKDANEMHELTAEVRKLQYKKHMLESEFDAIILQLENHHMRPILKPKNSFEQQKHYNDFLDNMVIGDVDL
jgi:hypothetical protein